MVTAMTDPPIRPTLRLPDDAYRARLAATIEELERWAADLRDAADIVTTPHSAFWRIESTPHMPGACDFTALFSASQTFSLIVAGEFYEDRPIDRFELFPMIARAMSAGRVERIHTLSALTNSVKTIETRIELEDGWAWVGERRIGPYGRREGDASEERRVRRFLPYRR